MICIIKTGGVCDSLKIIFHGGGKGRADWPPDCAVSWWLEAIWTVALSLFPQKETAGVV